MKGVACKLILTAVVVLGLGGRARADESSNVTDADRVYRNFTREAATVQPGQIRLEVRGMTFENTHDIDTNLNGFPIHTPEPTRITGGIFDLLTSYGLGNAGEVGALVPVFTESTRHRVDGVSNTDSETDVGDVQLYGKFKYPVAKHCSVAGGVELSVPTGIEHKGFGTGELGVNPFVATRYQEGRFGFGVHVGYELYTGRVSDILNYSAEMILRATSVYNIHAELSGRTFNHNGSRFTDLVVMPGIDFNLSPSITLRPTGLIGLTDKSPDWGLGVGLVYMFMAPRMAMAQVPPPPPAPAAPVAAPAPPSAPARRKIVLRGVNFDFDKSNIRSDAAPVLDEAASTLKEASSVNVAVEGHTDSIGSDEYNQQLSERRANAVRDYLGGHGVAESRMTATGFGESKPVASNDTDEGRAQNRRVELRVTGE